MTKEISYDDFLKLKGLLLLAIETARQEDMYRIAIGKLLNEMEGEFENGHITDAVWNNYSAEKLLEKLDISVKALHQKGED